MSRSGMTNHFSMIPATNVKRSVFEGPARHITSCKCDYLIPFYNEEVLPGDTFHVSVNLFGRTASLKKPIMDHVKVDTFYFFVPNRLLWDNWQAFMGEQDDPMSPVEYEVPNYSAGATGFRTRSLEDYLGAAVGINAEWIISLYSRAYYMIYNNWFRDENLIDPLFECKGDTDVDDSSNPVVYTIQKRGKRHDYFTSCLPWPQKGPQVEMPIGDTAPVMGTGMSLGMTDGYDTFGMFNSSTTLYGVGSWTTNYGLTMPASGAGGTYPPHDSKAIGVTTDPDNSGLICDLSDATTYSVNAFRTAMQLQIMLERDARGGTRYTEILRVHFGVTSPDARLQRPEYLGGSNSSMDVFPITQTSETSVNSPQANLSAMALFTNKSGFSKSFVEHGVVLGIACVTSDLTYQQGTKRQLKRKLKHDYAWLSLAHLGEQAVLNGEIYAQGPTVLNGSGDPVDEDVFGYNERYAEYRYFRNMITGDLRSNPTSPECSGSLDLWHLSQDFDSLPALNQTFIECNTPIDRVVAVPGTVENPIPDFIIDVYMRLRYVRPLPTFGVPGLMDHF